ncbi:hypothetical protein [Endozoicomonas sp. 4G]|uniref:hypothetical protein n=1 Tax=Endozoicomonas sp. 4G TaxID=2872754 RepID=UPI00207863BB|nr:hypothetical protein [Endozoicomonas sp. 4G]
MNVQQGYASDDQNKSWQSSSEIRFPGIYAGFKANNFHLRLGSHYYVIHDVGTVKKLSLIFSNQWRSNLFWVLLAKLLPSSSVPYPVFRHGFPSLSRAFGDAPDCNPHPVILDHPLLKSRLSVQTGCIDHHPVWQVTASPSSSSPGIRAVDGGSLSAWLSLWKLLNDTHTSTLFLRPWREDQQNRLQAIICTHSLTDHKQCQSILIHSPLNHEKPWLLPELAKKENISTDGQTALDSVHIQRITQAIHCLSSHGELLGKKIHACHTHHWLYQLADQKWLYQPGIPEIAVKPSPPLISGKYFNLWALEKVSPGNDRDSVWSKSSLLITRNDKHRKYHFWGAGDPVLLMQFTDAPYSLKDRYLGWDVPEIGNLIDSAYPNLAALFVNTVANVPLNLYQLQGMLSGFSSSSLPKSLNDRVREQIQNDPGSLYQFVKRRPELLNNVQAYLNREFPEHPVHSYFSGRVSPSRQANGNSLALLPKTENPFDPFLSSANLYFPSFKMMVSGAQGNDGATANQPDPTSSSSKQKAKQRGNRNKKRAGPDKRNHAGDDDNDPPSPGPSHPAVPADAASSACLLKHLMHCYDSFKLLPEKVSYLSDFLPEQLGIRSRGMFERLYRQCQLPDCESETLYNQMLRSFDPINQQHMILASKALENSIEVTIADDLGYHGHRYHNHTPQQPLLGRFENIIKFLLYDNYVVKLSYQRDNNLWFTHFLTDSKLNEAENKWLADNRFEESLWTLYPQWQKDILLCRESLACNAESASNTLKQAFTAPGKFMQGELGRKLFSSYNKFGLVCYPFDETENPDGLFYINKNVLGAVVFFWEDSASKYIPFIAPDLSISKINDAIQPLDSHLNKYHEGEFLVKKQHIRYVIPALIVFEPVFRKVHTEVRTIISNTENALVYAGLAKWQHLSSLVKPSELNKAPVTNNIDLAVKDMKTLEEIADSIANQLRNTLPGINVKHNNILGIVLDSSKIVPHKTLLHTLKINCFPGQNPENTLGFSCFEEKNWRILSIHFSVGPEGYFDFAHAEPFDKGSKLFMQSLPTVVKKLLQDTQLDQTKNRQVHNAQNTLKILLASDTKQQVQAIIQKSLLSYSTESLTLPDFLLPYIQPKADNKQDIHSEVESEAESEETITNPDPAERSKKEKKKTVVQKSIPNTIDYETALSQSVEISNWLKEMENNLPGELNLAAKTGHCRGSEESQATEESQASEENPKPGTELDTLLNQLNKGKAKTLQVLACSGASADTSTDQPVITINLTHTLSSQQRTELEQAAYEHHSPYAQLVQALFILNQKLPSERSKALQIYEKAYELLLPAAIAGIPLAYQLLMGMQLHSHHPAGWPQVEPVNRLLQSMTSRETSSNQVNIEGLLSDGFLAQLYQDSDVITLPKIERGLAKESDLSDRGKEVKAIINALREPDNGAIVTALKAIRPKTQELQQTVASLKLILERKEEPATGQIRNELWHHSLNILQIKAASKKKSQLFDLLGFPQVLAMTDLRAFMGTEHTGQLIKNNQPKLIAFWKMGFWEDYLRASLSKDRESEKEIFDGHHTKISNKAIKKSKPHLIESWILAKSLLISRDYIQPKKIQPPASSFQLQASSSKQANSEKTKRTVNAARQPEALKPEALKPGIRVSKEIFDKALHNQYVLQLDNKIIQEVNSMQDNPEKFLKRVERQILEFKKALFQNINRTNELGMGYYFFLKALAMIGAKMSDDNKTIVLSFSPNAKLNEKKIEEAILQAEKNFFPYSAMLLLFFKHAMNKDFSETLQACTSGFSGVSQAIEIFLEADSHCAVPAGLFLKRLMLIPKPFNLKMAFDADTYLNNPKSRIPGRLTPSVRLFRKFMEELPVKGSDSAVDLVLSQMDETFTYTRQLQEEQQGDVMKFATMLTAANLAASKMKAMEPEKMEAATIEEKAMEVNKAAVALAAAQMAAKETEEKIFKMETKIDYSTGKDKKVAIAVMSKATEQEVELAEALVGEAKAEAILKLVLHFATGRMDLLQFQSLDLSSVIMRFSIMGFVTSNSLNALFLRKNQAQLAENDNPEGRARADLIELAFHLLGLSAEAKPIFPHLRNLHATSQGKLTAHHFGHDLQFLIKLTELFPKLATGSPSQWYNILLLIHEYTIKQFGGNAERASQHQSNEKDWQILRRLFVNHIWHEPVETSGSYLILKESKLPIFDGTLMKEFRRGDDNAFILAIKQAREVGYQKIVQRLERYEGQIDSESLQVSSWLHCLAGLTLLEAQTSSDHERVILTGRKRLLTTAYDHFHQSRIIGFHYAGYLESLILMRLANHYRYHQDESSQSSQTDLTDKSFIQFPYTKNPEEKIFIEAGRIITEILPGLISSAMFGVRLAAEIAIRIFTDKQFNLLHTPQAGWPAILAKHLFICPVNYNTQFLFSNDGSEAEKALFPRVSNPDSIERILLEPLEEVRMQDVKKRPKQYGLLLDNKIKSSETPKPIKNYLSLVKAFVLGESEVLDISSKATVSDIDQLSENSASYQISRYDYTKLLTALQETPQPETGFDDFIYNLPRLKSHPNYEAISHALVKKHRTKSALAHYYLWAYEILSDSSDNERDRFWDMMTQKIEKNTELKNVFFALLATADLTVMYDDNREAMITAFKQYGVDLAFWLPLFHSISANTALFLKEQQKADRHFNHLKAQKQLLIQKLNDL